MHNRVNTKAIAAFECIETQRGIFTCFHQIARFANFKLLIVIGISMPTQNSYNTKSYKQIFHC